MFCVSGRTGLVLNVKDFDFGFSGRGDLSGWGLRSLVKVVPLFESGIPDGI